MKVFYRHLLGQVDSIESGFTISKYNIKRMITYKPNLILTFIVLLIGDKPLKSYNVFLLYGRFGSHN